MWYTGLVAETYKRNPNTKCIVCGREIYRRPFQLKINNERVFCSAMCYGIACKKEHPCAICGQPIRAGLNKKTCSRGCSNEQRAGIKYKIGSPRDKVKSQQALKVRLTVERGKNCERCEYNKYEILQVHHKNRDRENNNLDNLELICPNCHCEEHFMEKSSGSVKKG